MQTRNPYTAPKAEVGGARTDGYGEIKVFSSKGRRGRLRYIAYSTGVPLVIGLLMGGITGAIGATAGPGPALPVIIVAYVAILVIMVMLTIQRAHDFNSSGWLALLLIIPLVNLIFWFIPGTDGENRFGLRPPPNGAGVVILALIIPIVFVLGVVAAIAIPAYQDYVKRAQVQQSQ